MNTRSLLHLAIPAIATCALQAQNPADLLIEPVPMEEPALPPAPLELPVDSRVPERSVPTDLVAGDPIPAEMGAEPPPPAEEIPIQESGVSAAAPFAPLESQKREMEESEDGYIIKDAGLNDIFQFLARAAGRQYFHNVKINGPEYLVTGHLNDGNPLMQMEELAFMYGLSLHVKGSTIYALTQAQLAQLPSTEFHYQLRYLRPTDIDQIKELIKPMLSPGTGIVNFEPKTNTIIIVDSAHKIEQARRLLRGIDQAKGQIVVETKILRINSSAAERVGVDWTTALGTGTPLGLSANLNGIFGLESPLTTTTAESNNTRNVLGGSTGSTNNSTSGTTENSLFSTVTDGVLGEESILGSTLGSVFGSESGTTSDSTTGGSRNLSRVSELVTGPNLVLSPFVASGVLRALAEGGLATQVSNPTLITEDNEQATISIIDRIPIVTTTTTETTTGGNPTVTEEVRYKIDSSDKAITEDAENHREIGISLVVTPTLLPDGTIRMKMRPRSAQIVPSRSITTINGNTYPFVSESMIETLARVPDGHSLVVGGFYGEATSNGKNKVPLLGDIPVLNFFFKSKDSVQEKNSLVFVVTPKSYNPAQHSGNAMASNHVRGTTTLHQDHDWIDPHNPGPAHEPNLRRTLRGMQPQEAPYYPRATQAAPETRAAVIRPRRNIRGR